VLASGLELKPDDPALVSTEAYRNWREIDRVSSRYAANLLALGLRPGDRVASLMPNCDTLVIHYLACLKSGIVATPLNYRYMPPEIDHALETSGASMLLADSERHADVAASKMARQLPLGVIGYGANGSPPTVEALLERPVGSGGLPTPALTDPAVIFFTSGSTGPAKGVTHSFETLGSLIASFAQRCETTANDIILPGISLSHIGGFLNTFMGLAAGARVIVARGSTGRELLPLLRDHRPTVLIMLPAALFGLVRDRDAVREDFASIRLCISGGDKVPAELGREFTALTGSAIVEVYGMSETGNATLALPYSFDKMGSVGRSLTGYQLSIRDEHGNELPTGALGRLWVKSPGNMIGYWNDPEATRATMKDGWLDTGDVMRLDGDGYFWFCGRQKQIIVHDGSNISPQEVEDALIEHPAIASAGVVGVHDLAHGENVCAFVTLKQGATPPIPDALIEFARARIGYKAPENLFVLAQMPLNATGKVDRARLKKLAEERLSSG
jgi:acyl-CoA synthetase (AMP-forming)/AMP-acid ligase II